MNFYVDAETDGLYGDFLSVAVLVTDGKGNELDSFYGAIQINEDSIQSEWVKKNVYPYLKNANTFFNSEATMLEAFWAFWMKYREKAVCISYVQYPVECRLFEKCVMTDMNSREFLAPFPIYDLSTLLTSKGIDFNADMKELSGMELTSHDAMNDVRMMAKVWEKLIH